MPSLSLVGITWLVRIDYLASFNDGGEFEQSFKKIYPFEQEKLSKEFSNVYFGKYCSQKLDKKKGSSSFFHLLACKNSIIF